MQWKSSDTVIVVLVGNFKDDASIDLQKPQSC